MSSHSLLMMLFSKLAPQSLKSLASAPKIEMYPCHKKLAKVFAVWSEVTYAITFLMKWLHRTKTFTVWGVWPSSIVISMLVKSTWSSSKGEVTRIVYSGALAWVPLCWIHLSEPLIALCICIAMSGHQNWSNSRDSVHCWNWWPASPWHPFMATILWAMGTMNCIASSSPLPRVQQW